MKPGSNRRTRSSRQNQGNSHKRQGGRNSYDSSGPDGKVRGTAQQVLEKYQALGRDATSAGDRIAAEGYFQFAEHYYRVVNADAGAQQQRREQHANNSAGQVETTHTQPALSAAPKTNEPEQPEQPAPTVVTVPIMPGPIEAAAEEPQPKPETAKPQLQEAPVKEPAVVMEALAEDKPKPVRRRRARVKPAQKTTEPEAEPAQA